MPIKILFGFILFFLVLIPMVYYVWKRVPVLAPSLLVFLLGISLNMLVICTNGYKMPVLADVSDSEVNDATHRIVDEHTRFVVLVDHIYVSSPLFNKGYVRVVSIGDIFIVFGAFVSIVHCILILFWHMCHSALSKSSGRKEVT